jgi:hypothetical protein
VRVNGAMGGQAPAEHAWQALGRAHVCGLARPGRWGIRPQGRRTHASISTWYRNAATLREPSGPAPFPCRRGLGGLDGVPALEARPACRRHVLEAWRQPLEKGLTQIPAPGHPRSRRFGCMGGAGPDRRAAASAKIVRGTARRPHIGLSPVPPWNLGAVRLLLLTRTILEPRTKPTAGLGGMSDELALDSMGRLS